MWLIWWQQRESIPCWILVSARVGTIALTRMAKASAYIKGRNYVVPTDVSDVFKEVAVHRLQLSAKARVNHVTAEGIISTILESVAQPLPEKRQG